MCTSNRLANQAIVSSPKKSAKTTFALRAGLCFLRFCFMSCSFIAERLHYPLINSGSTNPDYPKRCDGIYVLIGGTKIKTINAKMDRKKNGNIPAKIPSKVMSLPSGI